MNGLENYRVAKEVLPGVYRGIVIQNDDPKERRRVKVRILGVYDEPVKKEHIPWKTPMVKMDVPALGEECIVLFQDMEVEEPVYMPVKWMGDDELARYKALYQTIVDAKKSSVVTGETVVDEDIDEPATEAEVNLKYTKNIDLIAEDVASENGEKVDVGDPTTGFLTERDSEKGKERYSENHPAGSFKEVHKDGTMVEHSEKDSYSITKANRKEYVGGNLLQKVAGYVKRQVQGAFSMKISGAVSLDVNGTKIDIDGTGNVTIDTGGAAGVTFKGQSLTVGGTVAPTGTGALCGLPLCLFSGAAQTGPTSLNN